VSEISAPTESTNKSALLFIFITLFIDVMGLGIIIPVLPDLIISMVGGTYETAVVYGGLMMLMYSVLQFFFSPILGSLSDQLGRRPVLLFSLLGFGVDYFLTAFAPTIGWLFVGRGIAGITGASFTTATAYIADISPPEKRAANFGIVGAAFGLGFIAGPAIGGALAEFPTRVPFFVAAGLSLCNAIFGYFVMPESLKPENRRKFSWKRANPIGSFIHFSGQPFIMLMAIAFFLVNLAGQSLPTTWSYFTMGELGWSKSLVGYSLAAVGIAVSVVQGGLIRKIVPWLGDKRSIVVGIVLYALGMLFAGSAGETGTSAGTILMFVCIIPLAFGGIAGATIQGMLSKEVQANAQGELQGFMNAWVSVASIIGPLLLPFLYNHFSKDTAIPHLPGASFFFSVLLCLAGVILALYTLKKYKKS
jgi:MFS transporter, DHA1 family, tetracycline resistance protein